MTITCHGDFTGCYINLQGLTGPNPCWKMSWSAHIHICFQRTWYMSYSQALFFGRGQCHLLFFFTFTKKTISAAKVWTRLTKEKREHANKTHNLTCHTYTAHAHAFTHTHTQSFHPYTHTFTHTYAPIHIFNINFHSLTTTFLTSLVKCTTGRSHRFCLMQKCEHRAEWCLNIQTYDLNERHNASQR